MWMSLARNRSADGVALYTIRLKSGKVVFFKPMHFVISAQHVLITKCLCSWYDDMCSNVSLFCLFNSYIFMLLHISRYLLSPAYIISYYINNWLGCLLVSPKRTVQLQRDTTFCGTVIFWLGLGKKKTWSGITKRHGLALNHYFCYFRYKHTK